MTEAAADICIDCEGASIYPSGAPCKSCGATGHVPAGEGIVRFCEWSGGRACLAPECREQCVSDPPWRRKQ